MRRLFLPGSDSLLALEGDYFYSAKNNLYQMHDGKWTEFWTDMSQTHRDTFVINHNLEVMYPIRCGLPATYGDW